MADNISNRERIEWGNTWWEEANNSNIDRIAMLGDSVTRGIRGKLNDLFVKDNCVVDCCCSSSQITDEMTEKQIRFFFEAFGFDYRLVIFQWGGQHGFNRLCCKDEQYRGEFTESLTQVVDVVMEYCNNIVFLPATPTVYKEDLSSLNIERNMEIVTRNEILRQLAGKYSKKYVDIYGICLEPHMVHTDYIHFDSHSNEYMANKIYENIEK
jgi:hypothetical protein